MSLFTHYYCTNHLSHTSHYDMYLAYPQEDPEQRVVLKVFDAQWVQPTTTHADFQRMEKRLQSLQHPHCVAILELGREQGRPYLVSEYQPGDSLREHLDHLPSGHLSLDDAVAAVMQVGQAVAFAHTKGVVHQDIRPENILLNEQGHMLLTNFYLGDLLREPGLKNRSDRRAVSYLAPEQTIGIVSPASDQYALGCLLYELVTGKFPNRVSLQQQYSSLVPELPRMLETVLLRVLALKPEERYSSVTTFLAELNLATQYEHALLPHMMEDENISTIHPALAAHAHITSLDDFYFYEDTEKEAGVVVPEHLAEKEAGVVQPEHLVEGIESDVASSYEDQKQDQKEKQLVAHTAQEPRRSAQAEGQNRVIVRASRSWKRPAGVIGAVVILLAIALLLANFFNSGMRPGLKHIPALAVSTAIPSQTSVPSTAVSVVAKPGATRKPTVQKTHQTPTVQKTHQTPTSGNSQPASLPTATPRQLGIGSVQIDSGGSGAGSFVGDEDFTDTTPSRPSSASNVSSVVDTSSVSNAAPESVYQSARIGDCLYTIAHLTPQASYAVRLHFAETYWDQPGKRTFDVTLNGHLVLHNFDIFARARGANKAIVEQFVVPADTTGTITIQFQTVKDNAQINGIEVLAV
jgi:serine/threonine protein kinase